MNVKLDWDAVTLDVNGQPVTVLNYKVYRGATQATEAVIASPTGLTFTDTPANNSGTYVYQVSAVIAWQASGVEGAKSNLVTVNTATAPAAPQAPGNLRVTIV